MSEQKNGQKNIQDSFGWAVLKLIVVPTSFVFLSFYLNDSISKREKMKEYLKDITELASKATEHNKDQKLKDIATLRSLARARTLIMLRESNGQSKRDILEFLANSDLQYQISLKRADLHNVDLSNLYLQDADLREANLSGADLTGAQLQGVDLRGAILTNTKLDKIQYDQCTHFDEKIKPVISNGKETSRDSKEECHDKDRK